MAKRSIIQRALEELNSELESVPGLNSLVKSIEDEHTSTSDDDGVRIKIPYVSAQPIHGTGWAAR